MEIKLTDRIDRTSIDDSETFSVMVVQEYSQNLNDNVSVDIKELDETVQDAFKIVIDALSFLFEENAKIWNIQTIDKAFDLSNSYIRDVESTETPLTEIPDGTPLIVQFETPSFTAFRVTELSLWYGQDFVPEEIDALSTIGISVSGNGTNFTVRNTIECRVNFIKPEIITDLYVINNEAQNQIIPI